MRTDGRVVGEALLEPTTPGFEVLSQGSTVMYPPFP
jgi:hypothetical protein